MAKRKKPVRLEKKVSLKTRIQKWYGDNRLYLFIGGVIVLMIVFVVGFILFMPGTESGVWYNKAFIKV